MAGSGNESRKKTDHKETPKLNLKAVLFLKIKHAFQS